MFTTKAALKDYTRNLMKAIGPRIVDDPAQKKFFDDLVARHPNATVKIGMGISHYEITRNPLTPEYFQLNLIRIDGSRSDISYVKCVTGNPASCGTKLRSALREAVFVQIESFRQDALRLSANCRRCGDLIEGRGHVDHELFFEDLVLEFLTLYPNYPKDFDDDPVNHKAIFRTEDSDFREGWKVFHENRSVLVLTCASCNLSRKKPDRKEV